MPPEVKQQEPEAAVAPSADQVIQTSATVAAIEQSTGSENIPPANLSAEDDLRVQWILSKVTQSLQVQSQQFYECLNRNDNRNLNELAAMLNGSIKANTALFSANHSAADKSVSSLDMFVVESAEELSNFHAIYFIRLENSVSMPVSKDGKL
jgi:hypothetical protein